jgi:hypothetical protein
MTRYTDRGAEPSVCRVAVSHVKPSHSTDGPRTLGDLRHARPRLGARLGLAGRWVHLAGGFVKIIDRSGASPHHSDEQELIPTVLDSERISA